MFVIIEGDEDLHLLEEFLDESNVLPYPARGKPNALEAARIIDRDTLPGMAVLVDRDHDGFTGEDLTWPDCVVSTLRHDFLCDLIFIAPESVERMVRAHSDPTAYSSYKASKGKVVDTAIDLLYPYTVLAVVVHIESLNIRTSGRDKVELLAAAENGTLQQFCISAVAKAAGILEADLASKFSQVEAQGLDASLHVNGHDLASTLAVVTNTFCQGKLSGRTIERSLSGSFSRPHLEQTNVYRGLTEKSEAYGLDIWIKAA
nr:hypothetical protein [Clavibacter michiganensis]